jgi:hypothetical protein
LLGGVALIAQQLIGRGEVPAPHPLVGEGRTQGVIGGRPGFAQRDLESSPELIASTGMADEGLQEADRRQRGHEGRWVGQGFGGLERDDGFRERRLEVAEPCPALPGQLGQRPSR